LRQGLLHEGEGARAAATECRLDPVFFDFNESALTTEATATLAHDVDCLKKVGRVATLTAPHRPARHAGSTTWRSPSGARSRCAITSGAWAPTARS